MMDSNSLYKTLSNKAVQLLAQRNYSSAQLKQKLLFFYLKKLTKDENDDSDAVSLLIDKIIEHCLMHHWLDDKSYIEQYIGMRSRKGYGKNRIIMELKQRGLPNVLINDVLNDINLNWLEIGIIQVQKKFHSLDKKNITQKVKIFQFLTYRGFQQDEINQIYSLL